MRVMTYNIRAMLDDAHALTRVIRRACPDILCVQEAPRFLCWQRKRAELARSCGLTVAVRRRHPALTIFLGPGVRLLHAEHHRLRWVPFLEVRGVAIAVVEIDGSLVSVASVHLDLDAGARLMHVHEIGERLAGLRRRFDAPMIVAGDFNELQDGPTWEYLARRYTDAYGAAPRGPGLTHPSRAPRHRIDAVFTGPGLRVIGCGIPDAQAADLRAATDHLPVLAEIEFAMGNRERIVRV